MSTAGIYYHLLHEDADRGCGDPRLRGGAVLAQQPSSLNWFEDLKRLVPAE